MSIHKKLRQPMQLENCNHRLKP